MANISKDYLDFTELSEYDSLLKSFFNNLSDLAIKTILFSADGNAIYFYKKAGATSSDTADYIFDLTSSNLNTRLVNLENKGTYAGGTNVTLNGTNKSNNSASFYAPTTGGSSGQVLISNGNDTPTWDNPERCVPSVSGTTLILTYNS
jgi:hypothetical protein